MSATPTISVIIPTSGRQELLLACVASILGGRFRDFEILVIDQDQGGILEHRLRERFPSEQQLRYLFLNQAGAAAARNFGIQHARSSIVAFIDDDALASQDWLYAIIDTFATIEPKPALVGGRIDPIWPDGRPNWYPIACEVLLGVYNIGDVPQLMPEFDQPIGANMAGLREIILAQGGFEERLGPHYFRKQSMLTGEETLLAQRVRRAGYSIQYNPNARVGHRISRRKLTRSYFLRRHFWEGVTVISQIYYLGELGHRWHHLRFHAGAVAKAFVRTILPSMKRHPGDAPQAARMLAASRGMFSVGVIYGLLTLPPNEERA